MTFFTQNRLTRLALFTMGIVLWTAFSPSAAMAAGVVGTGSPASCDSNDLAAALVDGGVVTFNCGVNPYTLIADTYVIQEDTTIKGNNRITLDGENLRQLFIVDNGASLILEDIVLVNGEAGQGGCISVNTTGSLTTRGITFRGCRDTSNAIGGGAVYNLGTFIATNTIFESNRAEEEGGAIFNRGHFTATRVTFEANSAGDDSGAIENDSDGIVYIIDSVFIGNMAAGGGGAVGNTLSFPQTDGSFTIHRVLFVDNTSTTFGGAINNVIGNITIINATFVRNTSNQGGAIYASGNTRTTIKFATFDDNRADTGSAIYRPLTGVVEVGYSIFTGGRNEADTSDQLQCDGPALTSLGYNLVEDGSCVNGNVASDIRNTLPKLGILRDNGGFTQTQMPDAGSPALNKVPAAECVTRDQRLAKRSGKCDIGAAERGGLFESAYLPRINK